MRHLSQPQLTSSVQLRLGTSLRICAQLNYTCMSTCMHSLLFFLLISVPLYIYNSIFQREYCAACKATPPLSPMHVTYRVGNTVIVRRGRAPNPTTNRVLRTPGPGPRNKTSTTCRKPHRPCANEVGAESNAQ